MVIYMYLNIPQIILILIVRVHVSNSLGSSAFAEIPFLASFTLTQREKADPAPPPPFFYSQSEVVYAYQV